MKVSTLPQLLLSTVLLIGSPLLLSTASVLHAATADLAEQMKHMKTAYRAALRSDTLGEFASHYQQLKRLTLQSGQQHYRGSQREQATYQQGFEQLQQDYALIEQAITRKDLAAAKAVLEKVRQTEKQYHQKLDV